MAYVRLLTITRSAEPVAPTPFKKFRHRELAQQNADTASAGMLTATTMPAPFAALVMVRSILPLLTEVVSAVAAEDVLSSFAFPLSLFFRAWRSASTTAFFEGVTGGFWLKFNFNRS